MISFVACAVVCGVGQVSKDPTPLVQLKCLVKLYGQQGLISAPRILTLNDQQASMTEETAGRTYQISVLPHVNSDSTLTTKLNLSIDGAPAFNSVLRSKSAEQSYIKVAKSKSGSLNLLVASFVPNKPKLGHDDLLFVFSCTQVEPTDPFANPSPPKFATGVSRQALVYHVTVKDNKGVITKPVVRTLDGYAANIETSGNLGPVSIGLLPRLNNDGSITLTMDFKFDGDEASRMVWRGDVGSKFYFKLWKEDAATPHVEAIGLRDKVHLKPGEWLVEVSGSKAES